MKAKLKKKILLFLPVFIIFTLLEKPVQALANNSGNFQLMEEVAGLITKTNQYIGNGMPFSGVGEPIGHYGQDFALMKNTDTQEFVYCIEPGEYSQGGDNYTGRDVNTMFNYIQKGGWNDRTTALDKKKWVSRLLCLVTDKNRYDTGSVDIRLQYMAIQTLIWEVVCGERDSSFKYVGPKQGTAVQSLMTFNHPTYSNRFWELKNDYEQVMLNYTKKVTNTGSAAENAPTITLNKYNASTGEYYTTFKDTNNIAKWYVYSGDSNVTVTVDSNSNVTIKTKKANYTSKVISGYNANLRANISNAESYITGHSCGMAQYTVTATGVKDPVRNSYFKIKSELKYTIQFNGNGATSGSMSNQGFLYDVAQNLSSNNFSRTGYQFLGWNTRADGKGTSYTNRQNVKNLSSTNGATITLYAQWKNTTPTIITPVLPNPIPPANSHIPPFIADNSIVIQKGDSINPLNYVTATDTEDGNITNKIVIVKDPIPRDSSGNTTTSGKYVVDLKVTDKGGATATGKMMVIVNNPPVLTAQDRWFFVNESIQKDEILEKVEAMDKEDGNLKGKTQITSIKDSDGNELSTEAIDSTEVKQFTVSYKVTDKYKASIETSAKFSIVSQSVEVSPSELRYISKDYLHTLSESKWKTNNELFVSLNTALNKTANDENALYVIEWDEEKNKEMKDFYTNIAHDQNMNGEFLERFSSIFTKRAENGNERKR